MSFDTWFDTYLSEKDVAYTSFEIEDTNGVTHYLDTDAVIEKIKSLDYESKKALKAVIVKLDFYNADITDYFKHLANGIVAEYTRT